MDPQRPRHFEALSVHAGCSPGPTTKAVALQLFQAVAHAFDSAQHGADPFDLKVPGNIHARIMNPTQDVLEQRVAALEGGIAAVAPASGQAAVTCSVLSIAEAGDNIVASRALHGGTCDLFAHTLPQYAIPNRFADHRRPEMILQGIETPALRADRLSDHALAVAQHLRRHPQVAWGNHAGMEDHPDHDLIDELDQALAAQP